MHHKPDKPTNIYISLDKKEPIPKIESTKLKEKAPTRSQFEAPIITKVSAI